MFCGALSLEAALELVGGWLDLGFDAATRVRRLRPHRDARAPDSHGP